MICMRQLSRDFSNLYHPFGFECTLLDTQLPYSVHPCLLIDDSQPLALDLGNGRLKHRKIG